MTTPAAERKTTPAASLSPTFQSPNSTAAVTAPMLGVSSNPPTRSTSTASAPPAGPASGSDAAALPPDPLESAPTDTRSDSDELIDPTEVKLGKTPIKDIFRGLVVMAGEFAHERLARTEAERNADVWRFEDEAEAGKIADPAASVVGRHAGGAVVSGDLADAIYGGVAIAAYLLKHGMKTMQIRRALRRRPTAMTDPERPDPTNLYSQE